MYKPLTFSAGIHLHDNHYHYDEVGGEVNFIVDLKHGDTQAQTQNSDDDLDRLKYRQEEIHFRTSRMCKTRRLHNIKQIHKKKSIYNS